MPERLTGNASRQLRPILKRRKTTLAALRQRYPLADIASVRLPGWAEACMQATWREGWPPGGTRDVVVTAITPVQLAAKLRRPGWKPPG